MKNLAEDESEEVTKTNDMKLIESMLKEAEVDDSIVTKLERHLARITGEAEYRRPPSDLYRVQRA